VEEERRIHKHIPKKERRKEGRNEINIPQTLSSVQYNYGVFLL
jgi:hypothetical protein